jgi:K+-sensing histidine kinase KdpD
VYIADNIMVCVTQQKTCERLIQKGAALKSKLNGELFVIHVAKEGVNFLGNHKEAEALEYLFDISKGVGADLTVLRSSDIMSTLVNFIEDKKIEHVVLGEPLTDCRDEGIVSELISRFPDRKFHVVPSNELCI